MTEPTAKHREEARELLPCPSCGKPAKFEDGGFNAIRVACGDFDCGQRGRVHKRDKNCHDKLAAHWNTRAALSSRDAEIREVLEGLRTYTGCWCNHSDNHASHCLAARAPWDRLQS